MLDLDTRHIENCQDRRDDPVRIGGGYHRIVALLAINVPLGEATGLVAMFGFFFRTFGKFVRVAVCFVVFYFTIEFQFDDVLYPIIVPQVDPSPLIIFSSDNSLHR
ncbi:hypothetical protein [Halovivax ruber]|uniref:hypothetical protein n=1 Tax=Halovivax ruber TaxID=387341 RepID=UPI001FE0D03F|nr:hypothetical protein [Halovivax ruber]